MDIKQNLATVLHRIHQAEKSSNREVGQTRLLAVSKGQPLDRIQQLVELGITEFGESYLQEALSKITALQKLNLNWHFIGNIQTNKTKLIAENFHWVHSLSRLKVAKRLHTQRPLHLPPLNVCIEINIDDEKTKTGVLAQDTLNFAKSLLSFDRLQLRGLMVIPTHYQDEKQQTMAFEKVKHLQNELISAGLPIDTLSMGMSEDFEQAVMAGSTIVRIGTALFGKRIKISQTS